MRILCIGDSNTWGYNPENGWRHENRWTKVLQKLMPENEIVEEGMNGRTLLSVDPFIKERCLFKDDTVAGSDKEYRRAMQFLCSYTMAGKNKHDDVPDAFAQLSEFIQSLSGSKVEVFKRPF